MIKRLKSTFALYNNYLVGILAIIGGLWVFGMIVFALVFNFAKIRPDEFINLGFFAALTTGTIIIVISDMMFYAINFNIAVSMGVSRMRFLLEASIVLAVQHLMYSLLLMVLSKLEFVVVKIFFSSVKVDEAISFSGSTLLAMLGVPMLVIAVSIFVGALLQRYGKTAFWILWGIYMFFAVGGVGISNATGSGAGGAAGKLIQDALAAVSHISLDGALTIGTVLCIILAGIGVLLFRKAPVK